MNAGTIYNKRKSSSVCLSFSDDIYRIRREFSDISHSNAWAKENRVKGGWNPTQCRFNSP